MIALFQSNTPRLLEEIRNAIARRDADQLARAAHALLSSLGVFGAMDAHRLTLQLEECGMRNDFTAAAKTFAELEREIPRIEPAMGGLTCALV